MDNSGFFIALVHWVNDAMLYAARNEETCTPRELAGIEAFVRSVKTGDRAPAAKLMSELRENLPPSMFIDTFECAFTFLGPVFWTTPECVSFAELLRTSMFCDHEDITKYSWDKFLTITVRFEDGDDWTAEGVTNFVNFVHDQGMLGQFSGQRALEDYLRTSREAKTCTKAVIDGIAASKLKGCLTSVPTSM